MCPSYGISNVDKLVPQSAGIVERTDLDGQIEEEEEERDEKSPFCIQIILDITF